MGLSADKMIEQVGKTGIEETEKWNWVLNGLRNLILT